ncbi:NAD(P)-binding domain-containing protein [Nocardioides stalactiti]|uniref:NAD(P)-binding domain-containing protein n=1 Tax=Nocardioides stalactiti TaxID=2755356 RepID=UPI001601D4F4|nr:NAD(P)-binding domain-containing protein [Nocardioides stalactiti]
MQSVTTVVIGAGHSGLAASRLLAEQAIDHVVLERGEVATSWRTQRWDSLRLLTPNWMNQLPGLSYDGPDPDGFLTAPEVVELVSGYAALSPVLTGTTVTSVQPDGVGFRVATDGGAWSARTVVVAAGLTRGVVPPVASALPGGITSLHAIDYKRPDQLPEGGVLVVGASSSGVQIAEELQASGRPVTLATGEHVRLPRRYRDRDILGWMDTVGILGERWDEVDDLVRARSLPSLQLIGGDRTIDLNSLQDQGVRLAGRLGGIQGDVLQLAGSLPNVCTLADLKLNRLLATIDAFAGGTGERSEPTRVPDAPLTLDLRSGEIRSVVWATGIKPDLSWLDVPTYDASGRVKHDGGVSPWPGLYFLGLPVLRRRRSTYLAGAAADAIDIVAELRGHLARRATERWSVAQRSA